MSSIEIDGNHAFWNRVLERLSRAIPPAAHVPPGGGTSLAHWLTHSPSLGFLHPTGPGVA